MKTLFFSYESDTMKFSFSFKTNIPTFEWKEKRWLFKRSKIAFIPAERNIVSVVPNWWDVKFQNDNTLFKFMSEWQVARKNIKQPNGISILNTGIKYYYDYNQDTDIINLLNGDVLDLQHVSSGLQSLIPLFVYLNFITDGIFKVDMKSVRDQNITNNLLYQLNKNHPSGEFVHINGNRIAIVDPDLHSIVDNFSKYNYSDIYLEEPEENLFPETQCDLVNWLAELLNKREHSLYIATHSPYILSAFNNLIQAGDIIQVSQEKKEKVDKIIGGNRAINYDDVAAYALSNGSIYSIKDDDLQLISPSELDTSSDIISNVFKQLLEL